MYEEHRVGIRNLEVVMTLSQRVRAMHPTAGQFETVDAVIGRSDDVRTDVLAEHCYTAMDEELVEGVRATYSVLASKYSLGLAPRASRSASNPSNDARPYLDRASTLRL
jgi:hypothetical protein